MKIKVWSRQHSAEQLRELMGDITLPPEANVEFVIRESKAASMNRSPDAAVLWLLSNVGAAIISIIVTELYEKLKPNRIVISQNDTKIEISGPCKEIRLNEEQGVSIIIE